MAIQVVIRVCGVILALALLWPGSGSASSVEGRGQLQTLLDQTPDYGTLEVQAGTYVGHFLITRPMTVKALGEVVLDGGGTGTILTVHAPDVHVIGLVLQHSGQILSDEDSAIKADGSPRIMLERIKIRHSLFGIEVLTSPDSTVRDCEISGWNLDPGRRGDGLKIWNSPSAQVLNNQIRQSRDMLFWYSDKTLIKGNLIETSRYGIHYMYSHGSVAEDNIIRHNSVGIYDMYSNDVVIRRNQIIANRGPSGFGAAVKESDNFKVTDNLLFGNRVGLHVDNSPVTMTKNLEDGAVFKGNRIERNDIGVAFVGLGQGTLFKMNDLVDNWQQVSTKGALNSNAVWAENYWSDYRGIDPKRTGFGTTAYNTSNLTDQLVDIFESFRVFNFGPAVTALEFAEQAIPWLKPDPKAVDHRPAMRPYSSERWR